MNGISRKLLSLFLALTLVLQLIPVQALGLEPIDLTESNDFIEKDAESEPAPTDNAEIVAEIPDGRSEFQKEFVLSNGMRMISIHGAAVHYEEDGEWKEIDNTLQPISATGAVLSGKAALTSAAAYKNTAGLWDVTLPASLHSGSAVEVSKDGYTLSFQFAGEIHNNHVVMSVGDEVETASVDVPEDELSTVAETGLSAEADTDALIVGDDAVIEELAPEETAVSEETSELLEAGDPDGEEPSEVPPEEPADQPLNTITENPEQPSGSIVTDQAAASVTTEINTVSAAVLDLSTSEAAQPQQEYTDKLYSAVKYNDIYANTDLRYDLQSNQLKESVIIKQSKDTLAGYKYTLSAPGMVLELQEDNVILAYAADAKDGDEPVFYMPAPFLVDNNLTYNDNIHVSLQQSGDTYTLTYSLPRAWLLDEERTYPVVLDPVVRPKSSMYTINDQTIFSKTTKSHTWACLACGYSPSLGKARALIKFNNLPKLTSADVIVSASMGIQKYTTSSTANIMEAHQVYKSWESSTVTWADMATPGPQTWAAKVEDANKIQSATRYYWDITHIAQQWYYTGQNTGVLFRLSDGSENASTLTLREFYASDWGGSVIPTLEIVYLNNSGLEDYWDYTSQSVGRAGTGYVNNFTGNLVWVHDGLSFAGNRMPVSISHIYNANDKSNIDYNYGLGYGWRTNYNQQVYQWTDDNTYYVWIDQDGTRRYFKYSSSGTYKNEVDDTLVLTTTGSGNKKYCITDKDKNKSYFDTNGRLTEICNYQKTVSSIKIEYLSSESDLIDRITDGAGRVYDFTYTSNLLSKIEFKGTGTSIISDLDYTYSNGNLTSITYPDNRSVTYGYTTNNLLTSATDVDGYKVTYEYNVTSTEEPNRVVKIKELDGTTVGGSLDIEYAHNQTSFTDHNGHKEIVQFNNFGSTISIQDDQGRAQFAKYAAADNPKSASQLTLSSKLQNTVVDLLCNGGFEANDYWTVVSNSNTGPVGYTTEPTYLGAKALQLTCSTANSGPYAYSSTDSVCTAKPGKTYTLSAYVKTTGMDGSGTGAKIALKLSNSGTVVATSEAIKVNSDWTRLEVTYEHNENASEDMLVAMLFNDSPGTAYFDCVQLEQAAAASRYNLIENGDFSRQKTAATDSYGWLEGSDCSSSEKRILYAGSSTNPNVEVDATPQMDNYVYTMDGESTKLKRSYQDLQISGQKGDVYTLAGWAKGDSLPVRAGSGRRFGLILRFCTDSGTQKETLLSFNPDTDSAVSWQYLAGRAVAPINYDYIRVLIVYECNRNTVYFDGIQLFKEEFGQSYTYDTNGNVISVIDLQQQETTYEYSSNNLTKATLPSGVIEEYTYDSYNNVKTATTSTGVTSTFDYDDYGNNTEVKISDGSKTLTSSAVYTNSDNYEGSSKQYGNQLVSTKDPLGKITTYDYDADTGVLKSVVAPHAAGESVADYTTTYTYDKLYRTKSVKSGTSAVAYGYGCLHICTDACGETCPHICSDTCKPLGADLLRVIKSASETVYDFTYTTFDLVQSIKVGNRTLISHEYSNDENHYLTKSTYGNEDYISYTYDKLGRTKTKTYTNVTPGKTDITEDTVTYAYDNNSNLGQVTDSGTGITRKYQYDFSDRLVRYSDASSNYNYTADYTFDTHGNLTQMFDTVLGKVYKQYFYYDSDNRMIRSKDSNVEETYDYDDFGRLEKKTATWASNPVVTDEFFFSNGQANTTSTQLSQQKITLGTSAYKNYSYTYDDRGNITKIHNNGTLVAEYTYDALDQLTSETNYDYTADGARWEYTYDEGGNITSKTEFSTSNANSGTTVYYNHTDTAWRDLLTSHGAYQETDDGNTVLGYDDIGNLTNDGTWRYTWEHGRQLDSMTNGSKTWDYSYNADGMRYRRTDGTTTYTYFYNGDTLRYLDINGTKLYFVIGNDGLPIEVSYHPVGGSVDYYYYVMNAQGDVIALVNKNGVTVVEYTYDAWGNVLTTGTLANTLGKQNPFRYRGYVYDEETGLYYLQSRYYNPNWGRFINADGEISAIGGDICGSNLFAYCFNNPAIHVDPTGRWTFAISFNIDLTFWLFGFSISVALAIDDNKNVVLQYSRSEPSYCDEGTFHAGIMDVGASVGAQYTSDDTVFDLEGPSSYIGFSAGSGYFGGIDAVASGMPMEEALRYDGPPNGYMFSAGFGMGVDVHLKETQTETIKIFKGGR